MSGAPWTEEQIYQAAVEDWLEVLAQLWTAVGKPIDAGRLQIYRHALEYMPIGLLELAVARVIRENTYQVVPQPGVIREAAWKELGKPWNLEQQIERWVADR